MRSSGSSSSLFTQASRNDGADIPSLTGFGLRRRTFQTYRRVKKAVSRQRRQAKGVVIDLTAPLRKQVLLAIKDATKASLANDPDMCLELQAWIRNGVDDLWRDVEREVELAVQDARHGVVEGRHAWKDIEDLRAHGEPPPPYSFLAFRAWVLYHTLPFDKSIFGSVKDATYWLLASFSMIPAVRILYYAMTLFLIYYPGQPDEYQLVQFILQLKATQFLSSGIGLAFLGGLQYFMCVRKDGHSCDEYGPGASMHPAWGAFDIVGNSVLIWASFLILPYSVSVAGLRMSVGEVSDASDDEEAAEDPQRSCCCRGMQDTSRGGRLRGLLWYDFWCFVLSELVLACMLLWHFYAEGFTSAGVFLHIFAWEFKASLYWARVLYSLLAFPFLVFNVPVLSSILTHTVPTGYNRNGAAVAWLLPPLDEEATVPPSACVRPNVDPSVTPIVEMLEETDAPCDIELLGSGGGDTPVGEPPSDSGDSRVGDSRVGDSRTTGSHATWRSMPKAFSKLLLTR
mmetsp:Transcript_121251/g.350152  ORF Transcript_121251/g.350152 Transcript_121251/m.350152 type:complete len:512 (+) Transcript_121251:79-1614(+)